MIWSERLRVRRGQQIWALQKRNLIRLKIALKRSGNPYALHSFSQICLHCCFLYNFGLSDWTVECAVGKDFISVQLIAQLSGKPVYAQPRLQDVFQCCLLKQFQALTDRPANSYKQL